MIYPDPGFPTYELAIGLSGAVPVPVALAEERGFDLDLEAFDARLGPRTRMIILNSPGNPTGGGKIICASPMPTRRRTFKKR